MSVQTLANIDPAMPVGQVLDLVNKGQFKGRAIPPGFPNSGFALSPKQALTLLTKAVDVAGPSASYDAAVVATVSALKMTPNNTAGQVVERIFDELDEVNGSNPMTSAQKRFRNRFIGAFGSAISFGKNQTVADRAVARLSPAVRERLLVSFMDAHTWGEFTEAIEMARLNGVSIDYGKTSTEIEETSDAESAAETVAYRQKYAEADDQSTETADDSDAPVNPDEEPF